MVYPVQIYKTKPLYGIVSTLLKPPKYLPKQGDKLDMPTFPEAIIDEIDAAIIECLLKNARITMSDLSVAVGLSAPATTERVRKLEDCGLVRGFTVDLDVATLGYTLEAIVRLNPVPGQLQRVEQMILAQPRFMACDKVTGEDCFVARLALRSIAELDLILAKFHNYAATNTSFVHSAPIRRRPPPLLADMSKGKATRPRQK
jgi:Lrp/AsnC family transcriptional regulator, leucine-responsive regulatory protein